MKVYMVIDDYTPDAGSTIYGIYRKIEDAEAFVAEGIFEEYGDDVDTESINIEQEELI